MQKIGIILYTQGNPKNLNKALRGLQNFVGNIVIIHQGNSKLDIHFNNTDVITKYEVLQVDKQHHVSTCYNAGLRYFTTKPDVTDIFIISDGVEILDDNIFEKYITASDITNLKLLCHDKSTTAKIKNTKLQVKVDNDTTINLNNSFNGMFVYLKKSVLERVGFFDERYKSALEFIDFYKRCSDNGVTTQFGWFADVDIDPLSILYNDCEYEFVGDLEDRYIIGLKVFRMKFKLLPDECMTTFSKNDVITKMKNMATRNITLAK